MAPGAGQVIRRRDMRRAAVQLLKDANIPGIGSNVFPSRSRKIWPEETGILLVFTQEDDADDRDTAPVIYQVQTSLVIRAVLQDEELPEDADERTNDEQEEELEARLDELAERVVRAMQPVHGVEGPLGGLVEWLRWKGTRPTLSADGEVLRNSRQILFSATWSAELPDELPEDEFLRIGTELKPPASADAGDLSAEFVTPTRTP